MTHPNRNSGQPMPWLDMVRPLKIQALPDVLTVDEIGRLTRAVRGASAGTA